MNVTCTRSRSPSLGSIVAIAVALLATLACGPRSPANAPAGSSPISAPASSAPPERAGSSPESDHPDQLPDWLVRELAELQLVGADHALPLADSVHVVVGPTRVVVEGKLVMNTRDVAPNGRLQRADPLFQELKLMRERWKQEHPGEPFPGMTTYWIDGRSTALVVKSVFQTGAFAGYPNGNFGVRRRDPPGRFARLAADAFVPRPPETGTAGARVGDGTQVSGRLPPEIIQRIVRQNYGLFRSCYEAGLAKDPKLEGKIRVRFVIGRDGSVESVREESTLPDTVTQCIVDGFAKLKFPAPEGGIVTVVYPIVFSPE